ncbi:MAG: hypothetical protein HQM14_09830 [SAR324 cluster bacterium]|nr:hypothetical protein [SAR324 cluster bacterium]
MNKYSNLLISIAAALLFTISGCSSFPDDPEDKLIFTDDFNRSSSATVGNGWLEDPNGSGCGPKDITGAISKNMLYFDFVDAQSHAHVEYSIEGAIARLEYDYTPQFANDTLTSMYAQILFRDKEGKTLGTIQYFRVNEGYEPVATTPTFYQDYGTVPFDGTTQYVSIDARKILNTLLTGVDPGKIATTAIQLTFSAGWCNTTARGYFDNVKVYE